MALSVPRALLAAQAQSAWNRIRSESGLAGPVATLAVLGFVVLIVAGPCLLMLRMGLELGLELRAAPDSALLLRWNALQALFTVVFAVLGSFRHRPAFTFAELGRFPVRPLQLLLAEIPAAAFEVFPILGAAGIVFSNLGLALRMPVASPLVAILALQGVVAMLALLFLAASARRYLAKRRLWVPLIGLGGLATVILFATVGIRVVLRTWVPALVPFLPGSQGYAGLMDLLSGRVLGGSARLIAVLGATAALVILAAWVYRRELATERVESGSGRDSPFRFRRPAVGIGRLFQKHLIDTKTGRILLAMPLIMTGCFGVVTWAVRFDLEHDELLQELALPGVRLEELPVFGIYLFLIVLLDSQIWMNQFGWDRSGIRTLFLLPIAPRDVLLGKTLGLLQFVTLQALIGALPLLWFYRPPLSEALAGFGAAGAGLVIVAGIGHYFSLRFPRAVAREGSANIPLYLSWIPTVLVLAGAAGAVSLYSTAASWGRWAAPSVFWAPLAAAVAAYAVALPVLAKQLRVNRERLLQM